MSDAPATFTRDLARYRDLTTSALLDGIPAGGPPYLYDLVASYPSRHGKGLRAALCLATCEAFGGTRARALNSAVAIELLHNGFLVHDDVQDASEARRGGPTLHRSHSVGIAVNVGNATNLLALRRLVDNRATLGPERAAAIVDETDRMMRHTLEGQALELAWIADNACDLDDGDYLRMCLKKTSWYSFVYPMRVGATIAMGPRPADAFTRFGWYLGAAFQIQDDVLNLTGHYDRYRKEIGGDLFEGKRTLMLIRVLRACSGPERRRLKAYLAAPRTARTETDARWLLALMERHGAIAHAKAAARQLAGAAMFEAARTLGPVPDGPARRFIHDLVRYVVTRDA